MCRALGPSSSFLPSPIITVSSACTINIMDFLRLSGDQLTNPSLIGLCEWGLSLKAYSSLSKSTVAIKLLWNVQHTEDLIDLLKEIFVMTSIQHLCLISLKRVMKVEPNAYVLVTDLMDMTAKDLISSENRYDESHIKVILYQVLLGLRQLNAAGIAHTGVSLTSVLINSTCDVKIAAFQSCTQHGDSLRSCKWVTRLLPPEAGACSAVADEKIDVYQAGVLFLSFLCHEDISLRAPSTPLPALIPSLLTSLSEDERDLAAQLLSPVPATRTTLQSALLHPYFASLDLVLEELTPRPRIDLKRLHQLDETELTRELGLAHSN